MDCLRDLIATLTHQTLLVMVGSYPRHKRATIPRQTRAPPTISLCHRPQNTTTGRVWLYTLLYGNSLCRLYATAIHGSRIVTASPSRYTAYTAYTAIHAIQAYSTKQPPSAYTQRTRVSRNRHLLSHVPHRRPRTQPEGCCMGCMLYGAV